MKIYAAEYTSCTYESGFEIISLHKTKANAVKALQEHKKKETHPMHMDWRVMTYKVEE